MARNSGRASNARQVSRPAQGNNSGPLHTASPAYRADTAPQVVGQGSVSRPKDSKWARSALKTRPADATPRIVKL